MRPRLVLFSIVAVEILLIVAILLIKPIPQPLVENGLREGNCPHYTNISKISYPVEDGDTIRLNVENPALYQVNLNEDDFRTISGFNDSEDEIQVIFVGDSQTWGWGVNRSQRFSNRFESNLGRQGIKLETMNLGMPGSGLTDYYMISKKVALEHDPDLIIVGMNPVDIGQSKLTTDRTITINFGFKRVRIDPKRKLKKLFYKGGRRQACQNIFTERFRQLDSSHDFDIYFFAYSPDQVPLKKVVGEEIGLIDSPKEFSENYFKKNYYTYSDDHFNIKGHEILAERLTSWFEKNYTSRNY